MDLRLIEEICHILKWFIDSLAENVCGKPEHSLSREEIKNAFWGEEHGVDNRVSNLLSTLRNVLKEFPEYSILVDEEKGYVLAESCNVVTQTYGTPMN